MTFFIIQIYVKQAELTGEEKKKSDEREETQADEKKQKKTNNIWMHDCCT